MNWIEKELNEMKSKYNNKKEMAIDKDAELRRLNSEIEYVRNQLSESSVEPSIRVTLAENINRLNSKKSLIKRDFRKLSVDLFKINHNIELLKNALEDDTNHTKDEIKRMYM